MGALIAALALLVLAGLIEAAMPALRDAPRRSRIARRNPGSRGFAAAWRDEPRRTRLAACLLRALVLAALLACIALAAPGALRLRCRRRRGRRACAPVLLGGIGWLRRDGVLRDQAAQLVAWLVAPLFLAAAAT